MLLCGLTLRTAVRLKGSKAVSVLNHSADAAGTKSAKFSLAESGLQAGLWVRSVTGTLSVAIWTYAAEGEERKVLQFPDQTSASSAIILLQANAVLANCRVVATFTGACEFEVTAKGLAETSGNQTLAPAQFDAVAVTYPTSTTEVYTYSYLGTTVGVVTLTYVDATKEALTSAVRS